jgi:hypothetical protein
VSGARLGSKPDGFFEPTVQRMEMKVPAPEGEVHGGSADGGVEREETI